MQFHSNKDKVIIVDFGSQFTQLIARKIREFGIYCEITSHKKIKNYSYIRIERFFTIKA